MVDSCQVPLNDVRRQHIALREALNEVFLTVLDKGWYVQGEQHAQFEAEFAEYCNCKHAVGVANGTDALELALRAAGIGPGDEVVTAANAGMYTSTACIQIGAVPVFADVDEHNLTLCPASVGDALDAGRNIRAIVVTHLYGQAADVASLRQVIGGRDVILIEDVAQAHGAEIAGRKAGSFGTLAAFSFYPTKNLGAMGDGGAVTTNDDQLAEKLRSLRQYGWKKRYVAESAGGRNSRLDELQAAILRLKLPLLDDLNLARRRVRAAYRTACAASAGIGSGLRWVGDFGPNNVAHLCVARHADRGEIIRRLDAAGVATAVHYPLPDYEQPALKSVPWRRVPTPNTEAALQEIFTLPCFPEMTSTEVQHVCRALNPVLYERAA